ncbi:MAG: DUF2066 domain-containing protein [Thiogranum sp.]
MTVRNYIAWLFALLLVSVTTHAARVDDLFKVEVTAGGRDARSRDAALGEALGQVLVRITGSTESLSKSTLKPLFKNPSRFAQQYRFREIPAETPGQAEHLRLWVQFDGVALAREVREAGLPYWGSERPDVLLWLAIDDRGRRYLVSDNSGGSVARSLSQSAYRRGLPLTLPLMDLEDQRAVQFTDVWGGFVGALESASQRYRPQVILVGKLGRSGASGGWRGSWDLLGAGGQQSWTSHAANLEAAVEQGIGEASEWLALQYAVVATGEVVRSLLVEGVQGLEDYARVSKYLASLTPVEQVQVARVNGREVEFSLNLNSEERNLLQVITLGRVLQAIEDPSTWRFRLNP